MNRLGEYGQDMSKNKLKGDVASSSAPEVTSSYVTTWVRVGVN